MRKIGVMAIVVVVFFSCKKNENFSAALKPGQTDTSEIVGSWSLEASRIGFAVGNKDTSWKAANTAATIRFSSAGSFTSDAGYAYTYEQYDRYAFDSSAVGEFFMLTATVAPAGNFPNYHARVQLINKDALVISYMGVDYTPQELYIRK